MNVGNFLTVFSVLIALVSFAYNSNRKIILYKVTLCDFVYVGVFLLLANYFLLFDWVEANGWYVDSFMHEGNSYLLPSQWAYVITLVFLLCVLWKIFACNTIPNRNRKKLLAYYEELILSDIPFLINCICRYHRKEIKRDIIRLNKVVSNDDEKDFYAWGEPKAGNVKTEPVTILQRIVLNHSFIQESIRHCYPLFFLEQVCGLKTDKLVGIKEAVECYYRTLLGESNSVLVDAISHTNNFLQDNECGNVAYRLYEYKFSLLTFGNIDFACNLKVWRAFGEEGLRNAELSNFFYEEVSEWKEAAYGKQPAKLCLNFYDILIRQIIYEYVKKGNVNGEPPFIYPYYLYLICNALAVDEEHFEGTYVESFWNDLRLTLSSLLEVHKDHNIHLYYADLLHIIESLIMISDYSEKQKSELLKWLMEFYIEEDVLEAVDDYYKGQIKVILVNIKEQNPRQISEAWRQIDVGKYGNYPNFQTIAEFLND